MHIPTSTVVRALQTRDQNCREPKTEKIVSSRQQTSDRQNLYRTPTLTTSISLLVS